jgi:hypothetical protein
MTPDFRRLQSGCRSTTRGCQPVSAPTTSGVFVRVNATDDSFDFYCDHGIRSSVRANLTSGRTGRAERQVCDGLLVQAPIRSDPSGRCAPRRCTGAGRQIERRTPWSYLGRGQTGPIQHRVQVFTNLAGRGRAARCGQQMLDAGDLRQRQRHRAVPHEPTDLTRSANCVVRQQMRGLRATRELDASPSTASRLAYCGD